jgi:prevent-host-death family protein
MTEVSVRELKSRLTEYIRRAEAGEEIAVTRRGKRVAMLSRDTTPSKPKTLEEKLLDLRARGIISWSGKKFVPSGKPIPLRGEGPTASEMILEDRGER